MISLLQMPGGMNQGGAEGVRALLDVTTLLWVVMLSLATWVVLFRAFPDAPLQVTETSVVVLAWAVIVVTTRWIWRKLPTGKADDEE